MKHIRLFLIYLAVMAIIRGHWVIRIMSTVILMAKSSREKAVENFLAD